MTDPDFKLGAVAAAALFVAWLLPKAMQRLALSRAKNPSLTGHVRWAKRIAGWIPGYHYDEARFFDSDGAATEVVAQRKLAFTR